MGRGESSLPPAPTHPMPRRIVTFGRALALLLAGVGIGAALFLAHRLRPESLKAQVKEALGELIAGTFDVGEVVLDLDRGIELLAVRVGYGNGRPALEAERIAIAIDQRQLLAGNVEIRQVDIHGASLHLRGSGVEPWRNPLDGILVPREAAAPRKAWRPPVVRIFPGRRGSRIELTESGILDAAAPLSLAIDKLDAYPDGADYRIHAELSTARRGSAHLDVLLRGREGTAEAKARVEGFVWDRRDSDLLAEEVRRHLPPVEVGGRADVDIRAEARLAPFEVTDLTILATLSELDGAFGNLHTGEAGGLPFRVRQGTATLTFHDGKLAVPDLRAEYRSPGDVPGRIGVSIAVDFSTPGHEVDFTLRGEGVRATTEDLHMLLEPDIVESIVIPFQPAGTFDFVICVSRRLGLPEKVTADLRLYDGAFDYAGRLDALTKRRFGFHYPLERCAGNIHIESSVPTPHGLAQVTEIRNLRGHNRIARPRQGGAEEVRVEAEGRIVAYRLPGDSPPEDVAIRILVHDLPIDAKLAAAFATTPGGMPYEQFELDGDAELVTISIERDGFREPSARSTYAIRLRDTALAYRRFPLHVRGLNGTITSRDLPADETGRPGRIIEFEGVTGRAEDGGTVVGSGTVRQTGDAEAAMEIRVQADAIVLGPDIERAIEASSARESGLLDAWRRLRPCGTIGAEILLTGPEAAAVTIDLGGTAGFAGYGDVDFPVRDLSGTITLADDHLLFKDVRGLLGAADILFEGEVRPGGALELGASVRALALDEPLRALVRELAPEVGPLLDRVDPTPDSWIDLTLRVSRRSARQKPVLHAEVQRIGIRTTVKGIAVAVTGGPLVIDEEHLVARDLWFRSGDCVLRVREARLPREPTHHGWILLDANDLHPVEHLEPLLGAGFGTVLGGNLRLDLKNFRAEFNRGDGTLILSGAIDLRRATVPEMRSALLEPTGALALSPLTVRLPSGEGDRTRLSGVVEYRALDMNLPVPVRDLRGELRIAEATLGGGFELRGAVFGAAMVLYDRHLDQASFNLDLDRDTLRVGNLDARFYGGTLRGSVAAHLSEPGGFLVQLRATDVSLGDLLRKDLPRDEPISGALDFALDFRSPSGDVADMEGRGEVRIRDGQLFALPGMRAILSVLGSVTPLNVPRFRTAAMDFDVRGEDLEVSRFHLGTAVNDVFARGTVSIYGDLDLVVEPLVTKVIDVPRLLNLPVLSTLRSLWHKTAYEIRLEGTVDSPALRLRALPFLKNRRVPFTQSPHAGRAERMRPPILP